MTGSPHRNAAESTPDRPTLIRAAAFADGAGTLLSPGQLLVRDRHVITAGPLEDGLDALPDALVLERMNHVLIPALVNVHCHLDLSHIGPQPAPGSFREFVDLVRPARETDPEGIERSVRRGIELALAGGTSLVGDIAGVGSMTPIETLRSSPLQGVSYLEVFGHGTRQAAAIQQITRAACDVPRVAENVCMGVQPHAPYSCGLDVYGAAVNSGLPISTHLAETVEEIEFIRTATGPLADLLRDLGAWDDSIRGTMGHPVAVLHDAFGECPVVAAHLNYVEDREIELLSRWRGLTVAYCPRASAYFGHANHRFGAMITAGINVAIGTDSIICLDTADRMSVLDDLRLLSRTSDIRSAELLRMATINGAKALGFDEAAFDFSPGPIAGILAVPLSDQHTSDPLLDAFRSNAPPEWVMGPFAVGMVGGASWQ